MAGDRIAIVGGTGLETLPPDFLVEPFVEETPFGPASLARVRHGGDRFVFLSRHGAAHGLAPHQIDYQANIAALAQLGVRQVYATNAVGSLRLDLKPGSLALFDDFIDFTRGRPLTYWEGHPAAPEGVIHTDFSTPYCPALRGVLEEAAADRNVDLLPRATYLCADGPRFESPAEIRMFAQWGGDVVGMTGLPEAVFAREAGMCYAAVGIVTNFGAGLTDHPVAHEDVLAQMAVNVAVVRDLLMAAALLTPETTACSCAGTRVVSES
jgi:5'-methylthioadenosine phosphorylase